MSFRFIQGYTIKPAGVLNIRTRKAFAHLNFPFIVKTLEKSHVFEQTYKFKTEADAIRFKTQVERFRLHDMVECMDSKTRTK